MRQVRRAPRGQAEREVRIVERLRFSVAVEGSQAPWLLREAGVSAMRAPQPGRWLMRLADLEAVELAALRLGIAVVDLTLTLPLDGLTGPGAA